MSKRQFLIVLGIWVMVFLFLGFSSEWDKIFGLVVGLLIVITALRLKPATKPVPADRIPFVEHRSTKPVLRATQEPPMTVPAAPRSPVPASDKADTIISTDTTTS